MMSKNHFGLVLFKMIFENMIFLEHFFKPISILHKRKKYTEKEIVVISRKKEFFWMLFTISC